jgi:hypothetical protein
VPVYALGELIPEIHPEAHVHGCVLRADDRLENAGRYRESLCLIEQGA